MDRKKWRGIVGTPQPNIVCCANKKQFCLFTYNKYGSILCTSASEEIDKQTIEIEQ